MSERRRQAIMDANVNTLVQILETEHLGAENATTNAALARRMGLTDRGSSGRHGLLNSTILTRTIQAAREQGHPIAADDRGVFYPRTPAEFEATVEMLESRSSTYGQLAAKARAAARQFFSDLRNTAPLAPVEGARA